MKTKYVCGFVLNDEKVLTVLKKQGPIGLVGYLNGVGGKVEIGETYLEAMEREFIEETSCPINVKWNYGVEVEYEEAVVRFFISYTYILDQKLKEEKEPLYWYNLDGDNEHKTVRDFDLILELLRRI